MSDNPKEVEREMEKAIFISADCWLEVFDLLPPSQLGLGIAMISHRFDRRVDEHFKTRKWTLDKMEIRSKIGKDGRSTNEMKIVNSDRKELPIPQNQLPRKVIGFREIFISFIDRNVIAFLHHFRPLFASCPIYYHNGISTDPVLEFILRNIWPMIAKNICGINVPSRFFHHFRKSVPSLLNDCPSLGVVDFYSTDLFTEFPPDDSANASDGQALAKWLFTPHPNNVPKVYRCRFDIFQSNWSSKIAAFKAAFANASSPVNFIIVIWFHQLTFAADPVVPFDQTNEFTREQLALKTTNIGICFLLVRCPIARDESKWTKWEEEAFGWHIYNEWNQISIAVNCKAQLGDGLLKATPGPSDQQK